MQKLEKHISTGQGVAIIALVALGLGYYLVTYAHHNSPMYEVIEENENFDNMDMHEEAIDSIPDNSNMDSATESGTYTDTSSQTGSSDGAEGTTDQKRVR